MRTIRYNTFETNSSSCHTVTIVKKDTYERYKNGELVCLIRANFYQEGEYYFLLDDSHFYDLDSFYKLIQKRKEQYDRLGDDPNTIWLFKASKDEINKVFFKNDKNYIYEVFYEEGELSFDNIRDWGSFLKLGCRIFTAALAKDSDRDPFICNDIDDREITEINDKYIQISGDVGVNGG